MHVTKPSKFFVRFAVAIVVVTLASTTVYYTMFGEHLAETPPGGPDDQSEPPPPDPRLTFDSPFRNIRPEIKYVGDAACTGCHVDIDKSYHQHPMGRSAELITRATPLERYDAAAHNPTVTGPFELLVERKGESVVHRVRAKTPTGEQLPDYVTTADLVIGSGAHGRSYVCLESGAAWQTPISWFTPAERWDLSPGFDLGKGGRRPIISECLFCHVNHAEPVSQSLNRFREPIFADQAAIGCERCHGPGELHIKERAAGPIANRIDTSIVNPKHLSSELRSAICAQCHLQGESRVVRRGRDLSEFRPGLPLELFLSIFVRHRDFADFRHSVSQFEQLYESRCFTADRGKLDCVTCHDPHFKPKEDAREGYFNAKCAKCHSPGKRECSEKQMTRSAKNDSCIACHMPSAATTNIVHTSITDHRIPRKLMAKTRPDRGGDGKSPLLLFPTGPYSTLDADRHRDLGIALSGSLVRISAEDTRAIRYISSLAEEHLPPAVSRWRGDVPAWLALSFVRLKNGDAVGGLEAARVAVELNPQGDVARTNLVSALAGSRRYEEAIVVATELIESNPTAIDPLLLRAEIYVRIRNWNKAESDSQAALKLHPLNARTRLVLAICRYHLGDPIGAKKEAEIAAGLTTSDEQRISLLETYRAETR